MKRVLALVLALTVVVPVPVPVVTAAKEAGPARDVCLRVQPDRVELKQGTLKNTFGLRGYSPNEVAKGIRRGSVEVVGPGTNCDEKSEPSVGIPRDDLTDVRETAWTKLEFLDGGRELDVHYISGVPACYGLDRVEVTTSDAGLKVRVFVGMLPLEDGAFCIQPTHPWVTTVDLGERLAFGSNGEDEEAEVVWLGQVHEVKTAAVHELSQTLPGYIEFYTDKRGREDFRFTSEGKRYALQFVKNPEATNDTLIGILLRQERLKPTYPPYPGQEKRPTD